MVSDTTIETINYVKDIDIEYNIKLIIICFACIYSLILIFISLRWEEKELWTKIIKIYIMQIPSIMALIFMPLFSIYLWRTASWELLYTIMIAYYSYLFVIMLIAGNLGFFTWAFNLLGINTKLMRMEIKRK